MALLPSPGTISIAGRSAGQRADARRTTEGYANQVTYERPVLVIFHGATGLGEAEQLMAAARVAAARATVACALAAGFEAVIFATDNPAALEPIPGSVLIDADVPDEPFEFAPRLRRIVERFGLEKPAVMGSGSVPLLASRSSGSSWSNSIPATRGSSRTTSSPPT
jgi:hypothetical protein